MCVRECVSACVGRHSVQSKPLKYDVFTLDQQRSVLCSVLENKYTD